MCQEMFFHNLATSNSGMPTPEICFLPGQLRQRFCTRGATAIPSVSVNRTYNHPIERRRLCHGAIAAPAKSSSPMPRCQVWDEGQYKLRTTGALTFASLPTNVISFFCSKERLTGMAEMGSSGEESVGNGAQLSPMQVC